MHTELTDSSTSEIIQKIYQSASLKEDINPSNEGSIFLHNGELDSEDYFLPDSNNRTEGFVIQLQSGIPINLKATSTDFTPFIIILERGNPDTRLIVRGANEVIFTPSNSTEHFVFVTSQQENAVGEFYFEINYLSDGAKVINHLTELSESGINGANQRESDKASEQFIEGLEIAREINYFSAQISFLRNLGTLYRNREQPTTSNTYYEEAFDLAEALGDIKAAANILQEIANNKESIGLLAESNSIREEAIDLLEDSDQNYSDLIASLLIDIATSYSPVGDYIQSFNYFERAKDICSQDHCNSDTTFRLLFGEGSLNIEIGAPITAVEQLQEALSLLCEVCEEEPSSSLYRDVYAENHNFSAVISALGLAYKYLDEFDSAVELFETALQFSELAGSNSRAAILANLGDLYRENGEYIKAIELLRESLSLSESLDDEQGILVALVNLGVAFEESGQAEQALDIYSRSLRISQSNDNLIGEADTLHNLGTLYISLEEFAAAEEHLLKASDLFEEMRNESLNDFSKISLLNRQQNTYKSLQVSLVEQGKELDALSFSERGRTGAFLDLLSQQLPTGFSEVSEAQTDIDSIAAFAQQKQTTFIEYSIIDVNLDGFERTLYVWVVSPQGEITFRQKSLEGIDLASLVTNTRQAMGVRGTDRNAPVPTYSPEQLAQLQAEQDEQLRQLHDILIDPITDLLPDDPNQPVVFIPQGELFLVPFPALIDDNGDYLIENHTILTAPSIQVLQLTNNIATRRDGASIDKPVIVGNPTMPTVTFLTDDGEFVDTQLSPLYGALQEANAVSEFLGASALTGDQATEAAVKQQIAGADLIHLATHGLLEYGDPRETGTRDVPGAIALTPGSGEDGLLTSAEILQMDLQADLVVLSACDTGRGRITGDGVIGLSRSFIAAGVPSVVVSLWAVPDAPTADLMTEFYRQLDQGQTKAQALRQAMLITMQDHPDLKDWAAFTLIGESE
ncbi:MAG: CHAT domain-containing protein [Leptolyngbya sp. SIO1E4]|nr:CHAT domain-containing protein [Leptolyngbya sp. SIO1E4]